MPSPVRIGAYYDCPQYQPDRDPHNQAHQSRRLCVCSIFRTRNDGTIQPNWTTLINNGVVNGLSSVEGQSGYSATLDLPEPYNGGKVYVLVQSQSPTATQTDLTSIITQESDINWENAKTNQYRVDSFEVSLLNQTGDAGNLTSVQGFGLPMELYIPYGTGQFRRTDHAEPRVRC
jgi:hypothetical protein